MIFGKKHKTDADSWQIVGRVFKENFSDYKGQYVLAVLLLVTVAATTALPAYLMRDVVNEVFVSQKLESAYVIAAIIFLAFSARGFATYGYMYTLGKIGNNIVARYQRLVFEHLLRLGVGYHKDNRSALVISKIQQNITGVMSMMSQVITVFAKDLLTLIALVAVMVVQDPYMSTITVAILPVLAFVMSRYVRRMKRLAKEQVNLSARVTSSIIESSQGMEILKSFTMEDEMTSRVHSLTEKAEQQNNRISRLNAKTKPPTEILAGFAIGGVIAFGGYRVIELQHDMGALMSFLTAAMLAYEPARKLASFRVAFEQSVTNARMMFEVLDTPPRQADLKSAKDITVSKGRIELHDVGFSYVKGEKVLDGLSLTAASGKTTALVGPSGGGKSTIISLIQRFYDLNKGKITVDGVDIRKVKIASLRKSIAYVSQQPILFEGSIIENIRLGRPDASDEDIFEAAELAQAHDFILAQPRGYQTPVGEMGANLSGGQRQRLSIARAFLRDAPILLLDEATSALDNESERLVQTALETLVKGRTTIVVAHRLSTIRNADMIYVIENGQVVEKGKHATLVKKRTGTYAKLNEIAVAPMQKEPTQ